jgi:hypothetical protein
VNHTTEGPTVSVIRADYINADGQRIVVGGSGDWWSWMVRADPAGSHWGEGDRGQVCHYDNTFGNTFYTVPDSPEFRAFLLGDMPPYAFADWLEETIPDIDARALQLLRLPYQPEPVVTSGRNL